MAGHNSTAFKDGGDAFDELKLAREGITLLLNNRFQEAEQLFNQYNEYSPLMSFGNSLVCFMTALMSFEDEKLHAAMLALQDTEHRCDTHDGFIKTIKKKITRRKSQMDLLSREEKLQRQIIIGDSLLYQAVLTFTSQDLAGYMKGGWILRRAWKVYEKTYREIQDLRAKANLPQALPDFEKSDTESKSEHEDPSAQEAVEAAEEDVTLESISLSGDIPADILNRLFGGVCFGYGTFQLVISMMPPKILKIIEFLGFEGDRHCGLKCLEYASHSKDMKAPLAMLGLLWYHTVIRPFFALDGLNTDAGVNDAEKIISQFEPIYPLSSLFLFFKARVQRLKSKIDESLATYQVALESCQNQREVQLICLYEIGWCNLMKLNYEEAGKCFQRLKEESRWSKSYYGYLMALCHGARGDMKTANAIFRDIPKLIKRKNNQIEMFVSRRAGKFSKNSPSVDHVTLMILEILYLWNALPVCKKEDIVKMQAVCDSQTDKKCFHLRSLIEGALYREMNERELSEQCFEEAIARHNGMKEDGHVPAFACYELGTCLSLQTENAENIEKAKRYFLKAKDSYKEYDFENRLNVRVHAALKRLQENNVAGTPV